MPTSRHRKSKNMTRFPQNMRSLETSFHDAHSPVTSVSMTCEFPRHQFKKKKLYMRVSMTWESPRTSMLPSRKKKVYLQHTHTHVEH
jgi:hypothetical protein